MGVRADFIWRTMLTPEKDWTIGEAVRVWDDMSGKYIEESNFKLLRQLYDILMSRTTEVGGPGNLRNVLNLWRLKESPSKLGPQARGKGKAEDEPEAQAAHRSDSGSEYSEDGDDEGGEYKPEENDQEEEYKDADSNQFETDEYLTDESEEEN
ncbi:hypothetical protein BGZ49_004144 [Haplosporangium sp. Z 27]|nr:hypothetical protein BGZ49_004144 [Haplosporangium sp. Z 27]